MPGAPFYNITVTFSLVTGTGAGLLSLLTWETLRKSPFGRAVFVLSLVMVVFILYHAFLLVFPTPPPIVHAFKSITFTGVTVFIWMLIWSQRQIQATPAVGEGGR